MTIIEQDIEKQLYWNRAVTAFAVSIVIALSLFILNLTLPMDILRVDNPVYVVSDVVTEVDGKTYPVVYKGEEFVIEFHYEKKQSYKEHTERTLVCESGFMEVFSGLDKNLPIGVHDITFGNLIIPYRMFGRDVPNDICYVRYLISYDVNRLRPPQTVPTQSENFYLTERSTK